MSFHLCSSPSSLLHDPNLFSVHPKPTPRTFFSSYNPNSPPFHSRNLLQTIHVSIQEAIPQETHIEKSKLDANPPVAGSKRNAWTRVPQTRLMSLM
ncbi:BnaC08g10670D [Brassica napus]|uniref:BnaC08g10670D protein n=1 Tax=Brassica napus TaxID=3708 RepID=A0A078HXW9_BRANA|nr:BnaC08g10670D [Brassica napus]